MSENTKPLNQGRSWPRALGNAAFATGTTLRNRVAYPAGRFTRNTAYPALRNRVVYPAGRFVRNTALPAAGQGALATGRWLRNTAAPAIGQAAKYAYDCVGASCRRHVPLVLADLGFLHELTPGRAITDVDRAIVSRRIREFGQNVQGIANTRAALAEQLALRMSNTAVNEGVEPDLPFYRRMAATHIREIKALYMMYYAAMGRMEDLEEPDALSEPTAVHIAMQLNNVPETDIEFGYVQEEDLPTLLQDLEASANHEHAQGGKRRRKTRKNSKKRSLRRKSVRK